MRIFLQEEQTKDEAAQVFEDYSKIRGYKRRFNAICLLWT